MKYKNLTKEQLIISFDRLTRFKSTKEKYFRVFSDIVLSCLIEPVYKKSDLQNMSAAELTEIAVEIINSSLSEISKTEGLSEINQSDVDDNYKINKILKECENRVYQNDDETQAYLENKIDYNLFLPCIDLSAPTNLRWLRQLSNLPKADNYKDLLNKQRHENGLKFPVQKVLLAEGITEEILLPAFSKYMGYDFYKEGIHIIAAGGKNQVVKMYYRLIDELNVPIFILLDKDAEENIRQIKPKLRLLDKIHLVSCGEFEDLLPKSLIVKTVNNEFKNFSSISEEDFDNSLPNAKNLENIFKKIGFHEFKKADFAKLVRDNISDDSDILPEIASIILEIRESKTILGL